MVDVPDDAELATLPRRLERPGQGEPAGRPRRLGARARHLPRIPGSKAQAARQAPRRISGRSAASCGSRSRTWEVIKRVAIGVYSDGFIHAGNLAYLALLSLFPFVIVAAAVARLFGADRGGHATRSTRFLQTMPPDVADVLQRRRSRDVLAGALRQPALARRAGRPVDDGQLHRDDPRHHPPRLWRHLSAGPSGNIGSARSA